MVELERSTGAEGRGRVVFLGCFTLKSNIIIVQQHITIEL
jgi:hypothetical protein